jgi:hypothetical protein
MISSTTENQLTSAQSVALTDELLTVELSDGRSISAPLAWYPRLLHGTPEERGRWRLIGQGSGIHWTDLDEDISVSNLLEGKPSGESQRSLKAWLDQRPNHDGSTINNINQPK